MYMDRSIIYYVSLITGDTDNYKKLETDVNAPDENGNYPLHLLVAGNNDPESENIFKLISYMVEKGVDVNVKNNAMNTPLHLAACRENGTKLISCLISLGAEVEAKNDNGYTPLDLAEKNHNFKNIIELINNGATIHGNSFYAALCKNHRYIFVLMILMIVIIWALFSIVFVII